MTIPQEKLYNDTFVQTQSAFGEHRFKVEQDAATGRLLVYLGENPSPVGWVTLASDENNSPRVLFYEGKGGLTVVVSSPKSGLHYFGLPGAHIAVGGVEVYYNGQVESKGTLPSLLPDKSSTEKPMTHQAMILGAGLATRFEPISGEMTGFAKPSVPLYGPYSVIGCLAQSMAQSGLTHLFINTFYKPIGLKESLNQVSGVQCHYLDETAPSGTAGGLRKLLEDPLFSGWLDKTQPLVIAQGDAVTDINFSALLQAHAAHGAAITIGCQPVADEDVHRFGIIATQPTSAEDPSGPIIGFKEKPSLAEAGPHRLGSTGFYVLAPEVYPWVLGIYAEKVKKASLPSEDIILDFAMDLFPALLEATREGKIVNKQGKPLTMWAQVVEGYWSDIGNPIQYYQTITDVYTGKVSLPMTLSAEETYYQAGVLYWPKTYPKAVAEGAVLSGPVIVASEA